MRYRRARLVVVGVAVALGVVWPLLTPLAASQRRRPAPRPPAVDYTRFSHRTAAHQKTCDSCHALATPTEAKAAIADVTEYPKHDACLSCHRPQFFARERPAPKICSVCHVGVTPRQTARHLFPNPPGPFRASSRWDSFETAFRINFPHATHEGMFDDGSGEGSCATCHVSHKDAVKTSPEGHASCFTCHSAEGGMKPSSGECASCHLFPVGPALAADFDAKVAASTAGDDRLLLGIWRERRYSGTFTHEGGAHTAVSCTTCHDMASANTADDRTVKVPVISCSGDMGCHITPTAEEGGALTYEFEQRATNPAFVCAKCHVTLGKQPLPASHSAALQRIRGK